MVEVAVVAAAAADPMVAGMLDPPVGEIDVVAAAAATPAGEVDVVVVIAIVTEPELELELVGCLTSLHQRLGSGF